MNVLPVAENWFPLSCAQRSRWFIYRLDPGMRGCQNNGLSARVEGHLALDALREAVVQLVARHPALRTCYRERNGEPEQCVAQDLPVTVSERWFGAGDTAALEREIAAEFVKPFELGSEALIRATLYHTDMCYSVLTVLYDHIAVDGWSYWQLFEELGQLLQAGGKAQLAPVSASYRDYVHWQRNWLTSDEAQAQFRYWQAQLVAPLPTLTFPSGYHKARTHGSQQQRTSIELPGELSESLRSFSVAHACTLHVTLLAAYALLLQRYFGADDLVIGCPMPGRTEPTWDKVVGDFVNPLPLRICPVPHATVSQFMSQVRRTAMGALANQDYPFSSLVDHFCSERITGQHPLFQTTFTFQKARHGQAAAALMTLGRGKRAEPWGGVALSSFPVQQSGIGVAFPLALETLEVPHGIRFDFKYSSGHFDSEAMTRLAAHFVCLLQSLVNDPDRPIGELDMLTEAQFQRLRDGWIGVSTASANASIAQLFDAQAKRTPDRLALRYGDSGLTYAQLDCQANQLAHHLTELGVVSEDLVGLCIDRGLSMLVSVLGILKAGAAYLPLDPAYPADRLAYMIEDGRPRVVLTSALLRKTLATLEGCPALVCLDTLADTLRRYPAHAPQSIQAPASLAYVIYTSGSTGKPKGVAIPQAGVVNLMEALHECVADVVGHTDELRVGMNASISFDASVQQWLMLLKGATVHMLPADIRHDPEQLASVVNPMELDVLDCTPAQLPVILAAIDRMPLARCLFIGGEAINQRNWSHLRARSTLRSFNLYGLTESTVDTLICDIQAASESPTLGRPIRNTRVYVLDHTLNPVPVGVIGELYIGGVGLARGYVRRPGLSAERFIADPFSEVAGARMYRTGDLGRYRIDGELEYLGRIDHQVKLRGHRLELGEIEAALAALPEMSQVCVAVREDQPGDPQLVAYLVPVAGRTLPSLVELRASLLSKLPAFMVPARFVELSTLPLSTNGKVNKKALPAPMLCELQTCHVEPSTATEKLLAAIWEEVLNRERVGRDDDFFELGGHSLHTTQVAARVHEVLGIEPTLRALFENSRLCVQAAVLDNLVDPSLQASTPELQAGPRPARLPLSYAQERLWLLEQIENLGAAYNISGALRIAGTLDFHAFERAINEIVRRHESLRTLIIADDETIRQVIAPAQRFTLGYQNLTGLPEALLREEVTKRTREVAQRSFDLEHGLPFRVELIQSHVDEYIAVVSMHHIVSDGWSLRILFRELAVLYTAFDQGRPSPLAELPVQYADFALWQRTRMRDQHLVGQLDFWKSKLCGMPATLNLPLDRPRPAMQSFRGAKHVFQIGTELTRRLTVLAYAHNATLFMLLLAAFQHVLARWSGQEDIVVGTPMAGRTHRRIEALVGFFVNVVVLRTDLSGAPSLRQLLLRTKETALQAYSHQDVPFERLVEELNPRRDLSRPPLVQVMINSIPATDSAESMSLPGLSIEVLPAGEVNARYELMLRIQEKSDQVECSFEYATDLFDASTLDWLAKHYCSILEQGVAEPDRPLSDLELPGSDLQCMILSTSCHEPVQSLVEVFSRQVRRDPAAIACEHRQGGVRYDNLDAWARRITHSLRRSGVAPTQVVGLLMHPDPLVIAALLGIFRLGAICLPLDPGHTNEHLMQLAGQGKAVLLMGIDERVVDLAQEERPASVLKQVILQAGLEPFDRFPAPDVDAVCFLLPNWSEQGHLRLLTLTQRRLMQRLVAMAQAGAQRDGMSCVDGIASLCDMLMPLLSGGCLYLHERHQRDSARQVVSLGLVRQFDPALSPADTTVPTSGISGGRIYVLDHQMAPLPPYLVGDLYADATSWTQEYHGDDDRELLTSPALPGVLLLSMGVRGRWRADGQLESIEKSGLAWLDGCPFDPAQVEMALCAQPQIQEAMVILGENTGALCLVAYVTLRDRAVNWQVELAWRESIKHLLPADLMSAELIVVEQLPHRMDESLEMLGSTNPEQSRATITPPQTSVERELAKLWSDVLGIDQVGGEDNFFNLGGHSLLATVVLSRIRQVFGVELPLRALFESASLSALALLLTQSLEGLERVIEDNADEEVGTL